MISIQRATEYCRFGFAIARFTRLNLIKHGAGEFKNKYHANLVNFGEYHVNKFESSSFACTAYQKAWPFAPNSKDRG